MLQVSNHDQGHAFENNVPLLVKKSVTAAQKLSGLLSILNHQPDARLFAPLAGPSRLHHLLDCLRWEICCLQDRYQSEPCVLKVWVF